MAEAERSISAPQALSPLCGGELARKAAANRLYRRKTLWGAGVVTPATILFPLPEILHSPQQPLGRPFQQGHIVGQFAQHHHFAVWQAAGNEHGKLGALRV